MASAIRAGFSIDLARKNRSNGGSMFDVSESLLMNLKF